MFARSSGVKRSRTQLLILDEAVEQAGACPGVARVGAGGEAPLGEVDGDAGRPGLEGPPYVALALVGQVALELLLRVAVDLALEGVEQVQHRRRDDGLLDRPVRVAHRLREGVSGVGLVPERPAGEAGEPAAVAVGEDREELPALAGEVVGEPGAGQSVGDGVGGERRPALLPVGDDGGAGPFLPLDRIAHRGVLLLLECGLVDLAPVVGRKGVLELLRSGQGPDRFGRDAGRGAGVVVAHRAARSWVDVSATAASGGAGLCAPPARRESRRSPM